MFPLNAETPAPFAVNRNTSELVVTAPLDREESENYRLLLVCTVQTESVVTKVETPLDVFVDDEDDNAPYVNGTDTAEVVISFNRTKVGSKSGTFYLRNNTFIFNIQTQTEVFILVFQGAAFGTLFVFDRDLTTLFPKDLSHNR